MNESLNLLKTVFSSSNQDISLANKTALVTGASAGIGLATSAWLAREGVNLILVARRAEKLEQLKKEITKEFPKISIKIISLDLSEKNFLEKLKEHNALNVDILINNAGLALGRDHVVDLIEGDIDAMINTNLNVAIKLASVVAKLMVQKGSGHIVNLGSTAAHSTYEGGSVYCATKFAIRAFSQTLRQELYDKNIRVSLVSPGIVSTEFSLVRFKGDSQKASSVYENMDCLQASDIARVILTALKSPYHVNVDEILIMPTVQSPVTFKVLRK